MVHSRPPPATPSSRIEFEQPVQDTVNAFLKSIKVHVRNLSPVFHMYTTELAVLERLYYKGNNQHAASLLWQRVSEMRRYGQRVQALDICTVVDAFRGTFYGGLAPLSSKTLKGAWSHAPNGSYCKWVLNRLDAAVDLLEKASERLLVIYHWITIFMQGGAFLQTTVTLSAIASRLYSLCRELVPLVRSLHADGYSVLAALHPGFASKVKPLGARVTSPGEAPTPGTMPSPTNIVTHVSGDIFEPDEDVGLSIQPSTDLLIPPPKTLVASNRVSSPIVASDIQNPVDVFKGSTSSSAVLVKKRREVAGTGATSLKRKKAKKPRDEIDDIFA